MASIPLRTLPAALALAVAILVAAPSPALAGGDWNDAGVKWMTFEKGMAAAKKEGRPVCLIVYTEWCPHCTNYSKFFHDPKIVAKAKQFVMIRIDQDKEKAVGGQFAPDGSYIPRTFFLSPAGVLDPALHAPRDQYRYFYGENDPGILLDSMEQAAKKYPARK